MGGETSCPLDCSNRIDRNEADIKDIKDDFKTLEGEVVKRIKTATLIAVTVVVVAVLSGVMSAMWFQTNRIDAKVDLIREDQVAVLTTLGLRKPNIVDHQEKE